MAAKLRSDCHDAVALRPLSGKWLTAQASASSGHVDRLVAPSQRIICTNLKGIRRIGKSGIRHVIFGQMAKNMDDLLRMCSVLGVDDDIGRCTLILSGEEITQRQNQEIARKSSLLSVKALIQQVFGHRKVRVDREQLDRIGILVDIDRMSMQFQLGRDHVYNLFGIFERLGYIGSLRNRQRVAGRYKLLQDHPRRTIRDPLTIAVVHFLLNQAQGRFGDLDLQ